MLEDPQQGILDLEDWLYEIEARLCPVYGTECFIHWCVAAESQSQHRAVCRSDVLSQCRGGYCQWWGTLALVPQSWRDSARVRTYCGHQHDGPGHQGKLR